MSGAIPAAVTTGPGEDTDLIVAAVEVAGQAKTTNVAEFDNLASSSSLCATDMDVANLSENTSGDKGEEADARRRRLPGPKFPLFLLALRQRACVCKEEKVYFLGVRLF